MTLQDVAALRIGDHLLLASDPGTDQETLGWLCDHWQFYLTPALLGTPGIAEDQAAVTRQVKEVRRALAANPSTPPSTLADLAAACPAEFCANPVTPLLLLEVPDFPVLLMERHHNGLYSSAQSDLTALLQRGDLPACIVQGLIAEAERESLDELVAELCLHVSVSGEPGDDWREGVCASLRPAAAGLRQPDRQVLDALLAIGAAPPWLAPALRRADARAGTFPRGALRSVRTSAPLCRGVARMRPGERVDDVGAEEVTCMPWPERFGVLVNQDALELPDVLASLAEDGNRYVRAAARARMRGEDVRL